MKIPFHKLVGVAKDAYLRGINLNEYAQTDFPSIGGPNPLLIPKFCDEWVKYIAKCKSADYTYGGYMEDRSHLWRGHYMKPNEFIHYGVDINIPVRTKVYCPVSFKIISVCQFNGPDGDWGSRLIVETKSGLVIFAHINFNEDILTNWPYRSFPGGTLVGTIASSRYNGGWFPHLHIQGLRSQKKITDYLDGYGKSYNGMEDDYPNPLDILFPI